MPFSGPCYLARSDLITGRVLVNVKGIHCAINTPYKTERLNCLINIIINTAYKKEKTYLSCQHHCAHLRNVYKYTEKGIRQTECLLRILIQFFSRCIFQCGKEGGMGEGVGREERCSFSDSEIQN